MAPHSSTLAWKSHGRRCLVGCSPWGREESDMAERLRFHFHFYALEKEMATHSSVLAWRMGSQGWGRTELDTTEVTAVVVAWDNYRRS